MEKRGERLKRLRKRMGISKSDLSDYLEISEDEVIGLENDTGGMTLTVLNRLCDLYCCDEKYILCMSDEYEPIEYPFGSDNISLGDLNAISKINQIYKDSQYLIDLLSE